MTVFLLALVAVLALVSAGLVVVAVSSAAAPVVVGTTCATSGAAVESGSPLISRPMVPQITGSTLAVTVPITVDATTQVNPGGIASYTASVQLDLDAIAQDVLAHRVRPGVVAAGYPNLAPSAWVILDLDETSLTLPNPSGTTPVGSPVAAAPGSGATASWSATGVTLTLGHLTADSRSPAPVTTATLGWDLRDGGAPAPRTLVVHPGAISFKANVTVGLLFFNSPVVGAVAAPWACTPDDPSAVLATTSVQGAPVSTGTTLPTSTSTSTPASTSTSTTSTTIPRSSSTTTPAAACAVSGFDAYGGFAGRSLTATGAFRTERIDGAWWLVDPDGHPFFSQGINNVTFDGTPDKNGATPYHDAVVAKYGTPESWATAQVQRMHDWGYNTLGGWSQADRFAGRMPYTVLLNQTSQSSGTGEMQDLFEPSWEASARASAAGAAAQHQDDPYLLGYWSDNELHFGPDWRPLHLFDSYLSRPAAAAGKQRLLTFLHGRYPSFAAFAADFTTSATGWADLDGPATVTGWNATGGEATRAAWVGEVAERYFSVTADAVHDADPHHLFLGARFISQTTGRPVLEAAARHVDVASFNLYEILPELVAPLRNADPTYMPVDGGLAAQAAILDKPIIISEWSYRAADSGLPNTWPPLFPTLATQAQRAAAYEKYVTTLLQTKWVVGQHWFEHADEPPAGRFDGEDSNFGLVNGADEPYPQLTAISKTMHDCAYARLLAGEESPTTTTTAPSSTTTSTTTSTSTAIGTTTTTAPVGDDPSTVAGPAAAAPAVAASAVPAFTG